MANNMKYDRIVEISQEKSRQKMQLVQDEIQRMIDSRERITVTALVKNTGLSKVFFYQNEKIRKIVEDAARRQLVACNSQESISNIALEEENLNLKMTIKILQLKVEQLERQNNKLIQENEMLKERVDEQYEVQ